MNKTGKGGFVPGVSGNPSGRPKVLQAVKEKIDNATEDAVNALLAVLQDEMARPGEKIAAAREILDRSMGKPAAAINLQAEVSAQIRGFDDW